MTDTDRQKPARKIPPLVWIIAAILAGIVLYAFMSYGGSRTTPSGGTVEQGKPEASLPPDGQAPAP